VELLAAARLKGAIVWHARASYATVHEHSRRERLSSTALSLARFAILIGAATANSVIYACKKRLGQRSCQAQTRE